MAQQQSCTAIRVSVTALYTHHWGGGGKPAWKLLKKCLLNSDFFQWFYWYSRYAADGMKVKKQKAGGREGEGREELNPI